MSLFEDKFLWWLLRNSKDVIKTVCHNRQILIVEGPIGGYEDNDDSLFKFTFILICLIILHKHCRGVPSVICISYVAFLRQLKKMEGRKPEISHLQSDCVYWYSQGVEILSPTQVAETAWDGRTWLWLFIGEEMTATHCLCFLL